MAWLVKGVLTEEEKRALKGIALELLEIRKSVEELAEALVNLSDKELLKAFDAAEDDFKEKEVDDYKEKLEKQVDTAKRELQS